MHIVIVVVRFSHLLFFHSICMSMSILALVFTVHHCNKSTDSILFLFHLHIEPLIRLQVCVHNHKNISYNCVNFKFIFLNLCFISASAGCIGLRGSPMCGSTIIVVYYILFCILSCFFLFLFFFLLSPLWYVLYALISHRYVAPFMPFLFSLSVSLFTFYIY